jgi:hypothetical protein
MPSSQCVLSFTGAAARGRRGCGCGCGCGRGHCWLRWRARASSAAAAALWQAPPWPPPPPPPAPHAGADHLRRGGARERGLQERPQGAGGDPTGIALHAARLPRAAAVGVMCRPAPRRCPTHKVERCQVQKGRRLLRELLKRGLAIGAAARPPAARARVGGAQRGCRSRRDRLAALGVGRGRAGPRWAGDGRVSCAAAARPWRTARWRPRVPRAPAPAPACVTGSAAAALACAGPGSGSACPGKGGPGRQA